MFKMKQAMLFPHVSQALQFLCFYALAVDLGPGPGAAFPFGEFDPHAGSNPIYGQRAFVSCHRCPQMAKLNMPPKSYERSSHKERFHYQMNW